MIISDAVGLFIVRSRVDNKTRYFCDKERKRECNERSHHRASSSKGNGSAISGDSSGLVDRDFSGAPS